jgi:hypothetical protein
MYLGFESTLDSLILIQAVNSFQFILNLNENILNASKSFHFVTSKANQGGREKESKSCGAKLITSLESSGWISLGLKEN